MLTFYHAPNTRSSVILWLLEEMGLDYRLNLVDIRAESGVPETYRAIHPHKKVPAIVHDGVTVTERAAITIYLTDAFPEARLAPMPGDPERGPFLTWVVYVDSVADPASVAKGSGWSYTPMQVGFGRFEDMEAHLHRTLSDHPYVLGDRFTAADIQVGSAVMWGLAYDMWSDPTPFRAYSDRLVTRPALQRATERDADLMPS